MLKEGAWLHVAPQGGMAGASIPMPTCLSTSWGGTEVQADGAVPSVPGTKTIVSQQFPD